MYPIDVRLVAAEFESGLLKPERLPGTATSLLVEGHDSPWLRRAAGADQADPDEQRQLFRRALSELGELPLTRPEVGTRLFRLWAERITSGAVTPLEGARAMWLLEIDYDVVLPDPMSEYGALDESDFPAAEVEQQYQRDIRRAAERWLLTNPG